MKADAGNGRTNGNGAYRKPDAPEFSRGAVYVTAGTAGQAGGGSFQIRGNVIPGRAYRLQFTDTHAPRPGLNCRVAASPRTRVARSCSSIAQASSMRYYRSVYP